MNTPVILESRYISVRGQPMHYVASILPVDPHPPVVLVHGVGLSHRYLLPTAIRLARNFRVYVPDLPGFGLSFKPERVLTISEGADWLAAWIEAMGFEKVALLGNSVGCQYVVDLAARYPERVLRAVLQGPTCDASARTFPRQFMRWAANRLREHLSGIETIPVLGRRSNVRHVQPATSEDYRECGTTRLLKTFRSAMEHQLEEKLPRMACPTLVVRGSKDLIVSQSWAEEVTRRLPNGRLLVIPGCAHTINLEAPLELYRVTRPFFEQERHRMTEQRVKEEPIGKSAESSSPQSRIHLPGSSEH